jgi:hypothetical protein
MRHVALPGVVDQHVRAAKTRRYRIGKGLHLVFVQDVAAVEKTSAPGYSFCNAACALASRSGCGRKSDFRPFAQQQAQRFKADPDEPPVTTATRPSICAFIAHLFPYA